MNGNSLPVELQRVHMVGIGGAGMSGVARILLDRGAMVSGSDAKESRGVVALRARGAEIRIGHDASSLFVRAGRERDGGGPARPLDSTATAAQISASLGHRG